MKAKDAIGPASYDFGFKIEPAIRIGRVEEILQQVIDPVPSRPTLIKMIRNGHLKGKFVGWLGEWIIYESSLRKWVRSFAGKKTRREQSSAV